MITNVISLDQKAHPAHFLQCLIHFEYKYHQKYALTIYILSACRNFLIVFISVESTFVDSP